MGKLTDKQKQKLPPEIRVVLERFDHEPQLYMKLKNHLIHEVRKIEQHALNQETFCHNFITPKTLQNDLLKIYGMSARDLQQSLAKVGFKINRMYENPYYQTLAIAYLAGLDKEDEMVRKASLMLIDVSLWNGRKLKFIPNFCDEDIARYVLNYGLKGNHKLKKFGSAFDLLNQHTVPNVDEKYSKTIPDNLDSDTEGLRKLIETNHSRINQTLTSVKNAYYKAHREGKKEIISNQYQNQYGEGEMVEARETFTGNIERIVDKIEKNSMLKRNVLMTPEAKKALKEEINISDASIKKLNDWFVDEDNADELKYFYELAFAYLKPKNESDICKYDVGMLANRVTSAKKDQHLLKAKEVIDHVLMSIMGNKFDKNKTQTVYRARKIVAWCFMINARILLCKKL